MEQQEGKNILSIEQFLSSLEKITNSFVNSLSITNKRIDNLEKNIAKIEQNLIALNTTITSISDKDTNYKTALNDSLKKMQKQIDDIKTITKEDIESAALELGNKIDNKKTLISGSTEKKD